MKGHINGKLILFYTTHNVNFFDHKWCATNPEHSFTEIFCRNVTTSYVSFFVVGCEPFYLDLLLKSKCLFQTQSYILASTSWFKDKYPLALINVKYFSFKKLKIRCLTGKTSILRR